jgi:hypothetical protein
MLRERGPSRNAGKQGVKTVAAGLVRFTLPCGMKKLAEYKMERCPTLS